MKALSPNPLIARDCPLSFYIDNHQIGLGLTLVTSFYLHHLVKDIISKYGNIPKCWGLGLLQILFKHVLIYLTAPGVSCGTWGLRSSGQHMGSSSLTRDRSPDPCTRSAGSLPLDHCETPLKIWILQDTMKLQTGLMVG